MIVQGDIFFTRTRKIPSGAKSLKRKERGYIITEGEATGHAHVVEDEVELYEKDGVLYMKTSKTIKVQHEEHKPVTLSEGIWKVGIVREFDPFLEEIRRIRD
jgi:hypothetical protein